MDNMVMLGLACSKLVQSCSRHVLFLCCIRDRTKVCVASEDCVVDCAVTQSDSMLHLTSQKRHGLYLLYIYIRAFVADGGMRYGTATVRILSCCCCCCLNDVHTMEMSSRPVRRTGPRSQVCGADSPIV